MENQSRDDRQYQQRLTKIVATLGPASNTPEVLEKLIATGVDVFRLNFSHGDHASHRETADRIRTVAKKLKHNVAILQDLGGPKLRIGNLVGGSVYLHSGRPFRLEAGYEYGNAATVGFEDEGWMGSINPGERIVLGDGVITLRIDKISKTGFDCTLLSGGTLRSRAGLSFPDSDLALGAMRPKDWKDLEFGMEIGVDFVALSFVRGPEDIIETKKFLKEYSRQPQLVAKIERADAVGRIDEILEVTDGVMVARGDLGISIPIERVPTVQKSLIHRARTAGKFSITATQMLESMTESPLPTRAEVTDVANAVYDGTDAVMLSGETAVGADPPNTVKTMARIIREAEMQATFQIPRDIEGDLQSGVVNALKYLVDAIKAKIVFAPYTQGSTASRISRLRCGVPVIASVPDVETAKKLRVRNGVYSLIDNPGETLIGKLQSQVDFALREGFVKNGDRAVVTGGLPMNTPGITNYIRALTIGEEL